MICSEEMATDLDQAYHGWPHGDFSDRGDSQDTAIAQILDHGSISFGRFAVESLSWEKRSVFTHNQCQEELEKFTGLVAQKKAYFEEYYRRMRALKALQANQQTEITLDYGGDGSVGSQTCEEEEEEETSIKQSGPSDGVTSITTACLEESNIEISIELESADVPHIRELVLEPAIACPDSSTRSIEEIDFDENFTDAFHSRPMDQESAAPYVGSSRRSFEEIGPERISSNFIQMEQSAKESTILDWSRRNIEENGLLEPNEVDEYGIVGEVKSCISSVDPGALAQKTAPDPVMLKSGGSRLALAYSHKTDKIKVPINKHEYQTSIPKAKESHSLVRKGLKSKCVAKSDGFKPSQGPKQLLNRVIGKDENNNSSNKALANRFPIKNKLASVSLHKPPEEERSSVTVPRPFSFATERCTTSPSDTREHVPRNANFKTSNRLTTSLVYTKGELTVQNTSMKKPIANGAKRATLDKKSRHGENLKKPSLLDSQHTNLKGTDGKMLKPRAWSLNLPAADKSISNLRTEFGIRGKSKEGNADAKSRAIHGTSQRPVPPVIMTNKADAKSRVIRRTSQRTVPPVTVTNRTETQKKMQSVPSRVVDPSQNGTKPRCMHGVKCWR